MTQFILLTLLSTVFRGGIMVFVKKAQSGPNSFWQRMFYTGVYCLAQSLLLLALPDYRMLEFNWTRVGLAAGYGVMYILYMFCYMMAMKEGPASLTVVISTFSSLLPILAGVILWNESITIPQILGLILFFACLFLFNKGSYQNGQEKQPITLKWLLLSLATMLCSGIAVLFTQSYGNVYEGGFIKEYLFIYGIISALICTPMAIIGLVKHREQMRYDVRFLSYTAAGALCVDVVNIIFMMYIAAFASAFYYPLSSVLGVVSVLVAGRVFLKEKISRRAMLGVGLSTVALVLLALG